MLLRPRLAPALTHVLVLQYCLTLALSLALLLLLLGTLLLLVALLLHLNLTFALGWISTTVPPKHRPLPAWARAGHMYDNVPTALDHATCHASHPDVHENRSVCRRA
ncbi:MAG: hypothetical protein WBX11_02710 [Thiobacillaceae bacterium]